MPSAGYSHFYEEYWNENENDYCVNALGGLFSFLHGMQVQEILQII